jgi:hypothetical protein
LANQCAWSCPLFPKFCRLNILAELLRFADRTFFLAWWNSTTIVSHSARRCCGLLLR